MRFLLRSLDSGLVLDEADNCTDALSLVSHRTYDLVLFELNIPGLSGLDALAALRVAAPGIPLVVLSGEADPGVIRASIEGGAMGYIPKSTSPDVLIHALRLVLANGVYLPPMALKMAYAGEGLVAPARITPAAPANLTPRQRDVLRCVVKGLPNKVIARELDLAESTVKAHLSAVFKTLSVHTRTEAVYVAANLGLRLA